MTLLTSRSIYYDDVNLIAQPTGLHSRTDVPEELHRIMVSPMQSIVGEIFATKALELGLSVCLHRFHPSFQDRLSYIKAVFANAKSPNKERIWVSVGMKDTLENVSAIIDSGVENIVIDVANGYMYDLIEFTAEIFTIPGIKIKKIMVGNIQSDSMLPDYTALARYLKIPVYIRCGIASGSACNTRAMTGYNRGQITELKECDDWIKRNNSPLILVADGGIATSGSAAKAFGAGASHVLMGGYFSYAKEAQHVVDELYKFWGGASEFQQLLSNGYASRHSEGKENPINKNNLVSLEKLTSALWGGLSSAVSYSGQSSLQKFIGNGVFELSK